MFIKITNTTITIDRRTFEFHRAPERLATNPGEYERTIGQIEQELSAIKGSLSHADQEKDRRDSMKFVISKLQDLNQSLQIDDLPVIISMSEFENNQRKEDRDQKFEDVDLEEAMESWLGSLLQDMEPTHFEVDELQFFNTSGGIFEVFHVAGKTLDIKYAEVEVEDLNQQIVFQPEIMTTTRLRLHILETRHRSIEEHVHMTGRLLRVWLDDRPVGSSLELTAFFNLENQGLFRNLKERLDIKYIDFEDVYCGNCKSHHLMVKKSNRKVIFQLVGGKMKIDVEQL